MAIKKNHVLLILKLAVIAASFALIFWKTDTQKIGIYLKTVSPLVIICSYFVLTFAQSVSALRTRFYFKSVGLELNKKFAVGLYFTGMFFNTILPGGIGGDAYKIYFLHKMAGFSRLNSLRVLLSDRASGLFALLILLFITALFSDIMNIIPYAKILLAVGAVATITCYFLGIKIIAKEQPKTAICAMPYSFIVQISGIIIIAIILGGLGVNFTETSQASGYIALFLISSVLAILPISIGGVGIREVSFMYGATLLGLNAELGVAIAIIYFVVNLLCSLNGLVFWHRLERLYNQ